MVTKSATLATLIGILSLNKGAQIVSLTTQTDAKLRKTGNPFAMPVTKRSIVNGIVGWNYENAVNRQRDREGNDTSFEAQPRKWGKRLPKLPFVTHNDEIYLELKVERTLAQPQYQDANGNPLTAEAVAPFLPEKRSNAEHQGVEREIILRDYKMTSILEIKVGGESYVVERDTLVASKAEELANTL